MTETATFAAGCFWKPEYIFRQVDGVVATSVGYMGGTMANPTYQDVCTGRTGHAEVVQVEFDPERISYERLLDIFWEIHDPTQINCQGPDVGTQYRSAIFFHSPEQEVAAKASKAALEQSGRLPRTIATEITPASDYWLAEDYHQQYVEKSGRARHASS